MNGETHRWIVALRWAAVAGQLALLGVAFARGSVDLPWGALIGVVAVAAISNGVLAIVWRSGERLVGPVLLLDTLLLSVMLALSGGPSNPFGVLFLVYVTLAAVAASTRWTWVVVAAALAGYGALFVWHLPLPPELGGHAAHGGGHGAHGESQAFDVHLQGMWLAFAIAATAIAVFVTRVRRALEVERERAARAAKLAATTTLAAGAAHELATPLATIKIAARELVRELEARPELAALREDAQLVHREVERSRAVLDRLSLEAGAVTGEPRERRTLGALGDAITTAIGERTTRVRMRVSTGEVSVPPRAMTHALASLVRNALDASDAPVDLALELRDGTLIARVEDRGSGMSDETLARVGEPFFTTKPPGSGMGLGVFLARAVVEQLEGTLRFDSQVGRGTVVEATIPRASA
ncbi:ATP-binding protein [Sandaracinus amylolyticus]|uniref:ATP-binding protein n=1 Tax=Sandaracinus amylolyticus TaxID=927083 RepID=UPI001F15E3BC|nr:ATP-binding protein [Sandaracinus amylolyticus]UJR86484.1 Hypothetical protein I5071_85790 [Sandaracinus amylolyticus]